jgi:hypothetical protein
MLEISRQPCETHDTMFLVNESFTTTSFLFKTPRGTNRRVGQKSIIQQVVFQAATQDL